MFKMRPWPPPAADTRHHLKEQTKYLLVRHHKGHGHLIVWQCAEPLHKPVKFLLLDRRLVTAHTRVTKLDHHLQSDCPYLIIVIIQELLSCLNPWNPELSGRSKTKRLGYLKSGICTMNGWMCRGTRHGLQVCVTKT